VLARHQRGEPLRRRARVLPPGGEFTHYRFRPKRFRPIFYWNDVFM
jgi:hypothetical protein